MISNIFRIKIWDDTEQPIAELKERDVEKMREKVKSIFEKFE